MLIMPDNTVFTPVTDPNMQENRTKAKHLDMPLRYTSFEEVEKTYTAEEAEQEAARCLQCPTHWCQKKCPASLPVTDFIGQIQKGDLEAAYQLIRSASTLPEICSRVCPQDKQCQSNCTRSIRNEAVGIGRLERYVTEAHYACGAPEASAPSSGKRVAIIGSGPAGLSAAQSLLSFGHAVTIYERADRAGGLLEYGIPNMKLDKGIVSRKVDSLKEQGAEFILNTNVGIDKDPAELLAEYDAVLLTVGTGNARSLNLKGAESDGVKGIYPALRFLGSNTKSLLDSDLQDGQNISAEGKHVVIIGGGDTGNDCLGTALRTGALSVTQIEMLPQAIGREIVISPRKKKAAEKKVDSSQEEYRERFQKDPHLYQTTVKEVLLDENQTPSAVVTIDLKPVYDEHFRLKMEEIPGTEKELPCQLLIIAAGFIGPDAYIAESFAAESDARSNIKTDHYATNVDKLFACGDCRTGQSLVVKAMVDGRDCAKAVNDYLTK